MTDREMLELAAKRGRKLTLNPIGQVFGRLTVTHEVARINPRKRQFLCLCVCGNEVSVNLNKLRSGHTRSCGCLHRETILANLEKRQPPKPRHGMNKSPEHRAWVHMRQRCTNPKKREFIHYGGRGIKVCDRWLDSFEDFFAYVGPKPSKQHSLDRIDVNGNYEPGNVRWATKQQQAENTRVAKHLAHNGEVHTASEWERIKGLPKGAISRRLSSGWTVDEAVGLPSVPGQKIHPESKRDVSWQTRGPHGNFVRAAAAIGEQMEKQA